MNPKKFLPWVIVIALVIFITSCYSIGLQVAESDDSPLDIIKRGFDNIVASIVPTIPESADDPIIPDPPPSEWNKKVEVTGGTTVGGGDMSNEFFGCGFTVGAFTPSDTGTIRIEFSYSWYPFGCEPSDCDPGISWCLHDSTGNQIYHSVVPNRGSFGPYGVSGVWDGYTDWEVRIGNNCPCSIDTSWNLVIYKLE